MANRIYFLIRTNNLNDRTELHVSHIKYEVFNLEALSKSIPANHKEWKEIVAGWRTEMKHVFRATELLCHKS